MVWAASECYIHGNSSVDYFARRYCRSLPFARPDPSLRRLSGVLTHAMLEVERVAGELTNGVVREHSLGLFASEAAMTRLRRTFECAAFLLMQASIYEVSALMRLALEQIAWSYAVHGIDDERLFSLSPTRSISKVKELVILPPNLGHPSKRHGPAQTAPG